MESIELWKQVRRELKELSAAAREAYANAFAELRGAERHGTMKWVLWCEEIRTYIRHLGCILLVPRYKLMCRKNL